MCSGGMFVQSSNFIRRHNLQKGSVSPIYVYGQEKTLQTVNLAKMNLAINGLRGEIKQGDSYSEIFMTVLASLTLSWQILHSM